MKKKNGSNKKRVFEEFHNFLRSKGFKLTEERKAVLEEVFTTHKHINAEDLFLQLRKKKADVSRATVYRTLNLLVNSGLVQKISFGEKYSVYEHVFGHTRHDHMICIKCGQIVEFSEPMLLQSCKEAAQKESFHPIAFRLQIFGFCKKCKNN